MISDQIRIPGGALHKKTSQTLVRLAGFQSDLVTMGCIFGVGK
jgi:hypothetical protein